MKLSSLSIILPCYNEEENVEKVIRAADYICKKVAEDYEILIINDGSKDKTEEIATSLTGEFPNLVVISQINKGYGGAIKKGFESATKDWLFFTDSDLQFDLNELELFIPSSTEYDFIFGYRIKRADKFHRILIAKMLKVWNKILLGFPLYIKDIDCAFKLMKRKEFLSVFPLVVDGGLINTEFILKIHNKGYKIKQIGVHHYPRVAGNPTGSNFGVIFKAVRETFVLRKMLSNSK